jgi:pilus assembly protein CpaB
MALRFAFFLLMTLGLVGFGTVAWIATRPAPPDPATVAAAVKVVVLTALHPVRAGVLLKPEDINPREVTKAEAGPDASLDTPDNRHDLAGAMVRRGLDADEIIRTKDVMHPGDHGFLAAVLGPGMCAVSVGVDAITGSAGLIWPGDRVDLILSQTMADVNVRAGHRIAAETVLTDVRVIAIDQQIVEGVAPDGADKSRTVTMEVTSKQAERVSVAERIGRLSLAVLSADHTAMVPPVGPRSTTWGGDVSPALGAEVPQAASKVLHVIRGAADDKEFRF